MLVNYVLEQRLDSVEAETAQIQRDINLMISQHQSAVPSEITAGMIYTGFENHHFDYYLKDEVILILNMSGIILENSNQITISTSSSNPLNNSLPEDIIVKEIIASINIDDLSQMLDYLSLLHNQEQLYYIDTLQSTLLEDGNYRIQMSFYVFYLENEI